MIETMDKPSTWDGYDRRSPSRVDDETRANKLLAKYREGGREGAAARDALVLQFRPLVQKEARHFASPHTQLEDLVQEGFLGLIHGIEQYDPSRGVKLITYVTHHVDGHLRHFLRDRVQMIKEPAWLQELAHKIRRQAESMTQALGREPTDSELAGELDLAESEVARIRSTRSVFAVSSLDEEQEAGGPAAHIAENNIRSTPTEMPIEERVVLEDALVRLKEIEQKVLYGFYYEDLSQTEIARRLGVSNNYVSHLLKNSARKLQQMFRSDAVREAAMQYERRRRLSMSGHDVEGSDPSPTTIVDSVTGLYTASYFSARLEEEVSRAKRHGLEVSVVRVQIGERPPDVGLFVKLAHTFKDCMRKSDLVARTGEHEVGAMLPHSGDARDAVRARLGKRLTALTAEVPEVCALTIGSASYPEYDKCEALLRAAEPAESV